MRRKLIQLAGKTLVVSLPSDFVKKFSLKKGDEIELLEDSRNIILTTDKEISPKITNLSISNLPSDLVIRILFALYKSGFDEINLQFDPSITDLKTSETLSTLDYLQKLTNSLIGMEIMSQSDSSCTIKQITKSSDEEFHNVLRRVFLIIISMSDSALDFLQTKNNPEEIKERHDKVESLTNYCLRLLNKTGYKDSKKTSLYYYLIFELEEISDVYYFITMENKENVLSEKSLSILKEVNNYFNCFYELFFDFELKKTENIILTRRKLFNKVNPLLKSSSKQDIILYCRLAVLILKIFNLTETRISMEF